ncbi:MAG: type II toxin-antitoxin system PemK/MazF family toxin [Deltaproteobacteria bacterium]|nr:type II toxin-antitoxin system PemK/MazF family toxin [Deltaproteobacteria bacterium]
MVDYIPKRGDFIRLNFDPQAGHEQMGSSPALVLSHTPFNSKMGFVFVCPITTTKRRNPFYVTIPEGEKVSGVIMADQLRSLDHRARKGAFISRCPEMLLQEVLMHVEPILF